MRAIVIAATLAFAGYALPAYTQTIYPIDRADILAGSRFDFKVEFPDLRGTDSAAVAINGEDHAKVFGTAASMVTEKIGDKEMSALVLRDVSLKPGTYRVKAGDSEVAWNVYATGQRKARNVILFVGDGLSLSHRVAARLLSKGIKQGKTNGKLAMDDMPHMALVATAGSDSIITDSANSASAYATGHKTANAALGVYADRTPNPFDDPRVETISSLVKRRHNMAIGIVTNTEIEDATPAAMAAHTRNRRSYGQIVEQFFDAKPDVLMGGGAAHFLPKGALGSKRRDEVNFIEKFTAEGYRFAATGSELAIAAQEVTTSRLLGLFHTGNMDGVLDRKFLKGGTAKAFPDQPDLTEQMQAALAVLSRNPNGFFLMVESGLIDKFAHALDMERAVYDTIMLDNAVRIAKDWSKARGDDTLILVVSDHAHPNSLVGTINDDMASIPNTPLRERLGVYDKAGFPNYPSPDAGGYPPRVDVSRRIAILSAALPDHYETLRPKLDAPNEPAMRGTAPRTYVANDKYKDAPGAMLRLGNLPAYLGASVHSGEDVILTATGPGADRVRGSMDNTEVFRVMAEALGLAPGE
ncbi:MAG: alkaline phosphatase [Pseudolabrys sp.]